MVIRQHVEHVIVNIHTIDTLTHVALCASQIESSNMMHIWYFYAKFLEKRFTYIWINMIILPTPFLLVFMKLHSFIPSFIPNNNA
jgi:hypothetical protein